MYENVAAITEAYRRRLKFEAQIWADDALAQARNYAAYCKTHDEIRAVTLDKIARYSDGQLLVRDSEVRVPFPTVEDLELNNQFALEFICSFHDCGNRSMRILDQLPLFKVKERLKYWGECKLHESKP